MKGDFAVSKTVNKVLAIASAALLAAGIVFTGMNLFCGVSAWCRAGTRF